MRPTQYFYNKNSKLDSTGIPLNTMKAKDFDTLITELRKIKAKCRTHYKRDWNFFEFGKDYNTLLRKLFNLGKKSLPPTKFREGSQIFKIPDSNALPMKKQTYKSGFSPLRRVRLGRVTQDSKSMQNPKMSFRPHFLNSNAKSFSSTNTSKQLRKELVEKMVFLAENALKENKGEYKQSTPIKPIPKLTPKKTPKSRSYILLPEFVKKVPDINEMRTPVKNLIKKEVFCSSVKKTPSKKTHAQEDKNKKNVLQNPLELDNSSLSTSIAKDVIINEIGNFFQSYNSKVNSLFEKCMSVDDNFEEEVKKLPEGEIYDKFCFYQAEKEVISKELIELDEKFACSLKEKKQSNEKLLEFINENRKLFEKQLGVHKKFEKSISCILKNYKTNNKCEKKENNDLEECSKLIPSSKQEETKDFLNKIESFEEKNKPVLRRSLRLSKLPRKITESTPSKKKLSHVNSKSKNILKSKYSTRVKSKI
ncbi:conserved hypothetical protein [Pediculus humanus corporis]|uniref:Uncharacterized protein n=1 Tax=Pediculus humanus subsp. corporis TaxID=121224 RepID=E0VNN3_PEDHC|nr:uncharacterized protein Phum_PHUM338350 [Pediculus humanus corporis]EEB14989.1 conserved hypothetical protein [Pediculus humanus corporis]